ncbi:MAG: response regulator [Candidatus Electryonea clarkiae]|nr:response regulator [Candidatus Electryonea clarkiae]MDP8285593.1 response regulator [Candidatus Electryonea clarkiae]
MAEAKVLLVDDEEDFTEVLSERMETRGFEVHVSSNGYDALKMAQENFYDAVILDVMMPGMDGIETLKHLLAGNPDLQVILLTGVATLQKGLEALKSGAMEFLEKPADINKLMDLIIKARTTRERLTDERIDATMNKILKKRAW